MARVIKKVLLCPPIYFQIRYQINPWMKTADQINQPQAQQQWLKLTSLYTHLGIKIATIRPRPDLPDMIFTADQGLVENSSVILANFRFKQRRPETKTYQRWFKKQGFRILTLPKNLYFEGGDILRACRKIIAGHGFRTSPQAPQAIAKLLKNPVISLKLISPYFYHLDTCLLPLSPREAFYYPSAFDQASQKKLAQLFSKLIPFTKKEAFSLAANSISTDHQIIIPSSAATLVKKLAQLGYKAFLAEVGEFAKAGGGIRCLTTTTKVR